MTTTLAVRIGFAVAMALGVCSPFYASAAIYKEIVKVKVSGSPMVRPYQNGVLKAEFESESSKVVGAQYCFSLDCMSYTLEELKAGVSPITVGGKSYVSVRAPQFDEDVSSVVEVDFESIAGRRRLHLLATRVEGAVPYRVEVDENLGRTEFDELGIVVAPALLNGVKYIVLKRRGVQVAHIHPRELDPVDP